MKTMQPTYDAKLWQDDDAAIHRVMCGIKNSLGPLSHADAVLVEGTLQKYNMTTGVNDAAEGRHSGVSDAERGRQAGQKVRAEIDHNRSVAAGYKNFWDQKNAELAASIRR